MNKHDVSHFKRILVVDTTQTEATAVALIENGTATVLKRDIRAQKLQEMIQALLQKTELGFEQLEAVAVLQGPGSYTGTRMGIAAANTLGWLQHLPIIELPGNDLSGSIDSLINRQKFTVTKQAKPRY